MTSGEDPGEHMEGLAGSGTKGPGNEADALVEDALRLSAEGAVLAGGGPELAAIREDGEADGVEDEAPVGHGQAAVCVAEDLEGLEGSTGAVAHDGDMRRPIKTEMKEEAQVTYDRFGCNPVVGMGGLIHEV